MKIKSIKEVAEEVAKVHGHYLAGVALEDVLISAWIKNMRIAYPRFTMCVSYNSADIDTVAELIAEYQQIAVDKNAVKS